MSRFGFPVCGCAWFVGSFMKFFAHIAQSVEHFLGKEEVTGSNPVMSSNIVG